MPVVKQVVLSETMRKHGRICEKTELVKHGFKIDSAACIPSDEVDCAGLDEKVSKDAVIIFAVDNTENILENIATTTKFNGMEDLVEYLNFVQIFDIQLSSTSQKLLAAKYLTVIKEESEERWVALSKVDLDIIRIHPYLFDLLFNMSPTLESREKKMEIMMSYFVGTEDNKSPDIEKWEEEKSKEMKSFRMSIMALPKFESIMPVEMFRKMLDVCLNTAHYYLFSEIYCTMISFPGHYSFIFDSVVAELYCKWQKMASQLEQYRLIDRIHEVANLWPSKQFIFMNLLLIIMLI